MLSLCDSGATSGSASLHFGRGKGHLHHLVHVLDEVPGQPVLHLIGNVVKGRVAVDFVGRGFEHLARFGRVTRVVGLVIEAAGHPRAFETAFRAASSEASILILGPSGTGKTTLLRLLTGQARASAGSARRLSPALR